MAFLLFPALLLVAAMKGEEKPLRSVELLLLEPRRPSMLEVGLHIKLAPAWHLYWVNPGDAGLAPEVTWDLPPGYVAGPLRYPVPEKIVNGEIVTYGFKTEVLITCLIRPAGPQVSTKPLAIACRLNWMACRESCITGQENVVISPEAQTPAALKKAGEIMSRFAARFPKPIKTTRVFAKDARLVKSGSGWHVEILLSGKDASRVSDFYPYSPENFVIAHSRIASRGESVIIPLEPSGPSAALERINGLLVLGDDAYEVSIPVKTISHPS